ncbi:hypothetical protein KKI24_02455 [bacterium]|nr:hypothetical protein [bacterium]
MKQRNHSWEFRKRPVPFNPDRTYLQQALDEYLARGGRISTLIPDDTNYRAFIESNRGLADADAFLMGQY